MKKKIFQKTLFIVGILAFISGYSNDNDYDECEDYKSTFQGHAAPKDQMDKKYNHPARIDVRGSWDYYISGSYIYWQPREDGLELAKETVVPEPIENPGVSNNTLVHMDFDYHSGFKVGTGGNFERDDWSVDFEYTRLYTTDHRSKTLSNDLQILLNHFLTPFWQNDRFGDISFSTKSRWKLRFNILDGVLARSYYVGTKLSFKPFMGLRAGWIGQRHNVDYAFSNLSVPQVIYNYYSRCKSSSWLLGARMGVDTNWHLGEGFRLFGNTAGSIFYQRFKTNLNFVSEEDLPATRTSKISEREGYFNPNFEVALGLGWGTYFDSDKWHIDLSAAYEFHIFWYQNMMRKLLDYEDFYHDPTPGDLILHGLTVSLTLDF